jgi:hypothetical protein
MDEKRWCTFLIVRSNKKQHILESNLRLENRYLSEKLTDDEELDYLFIEVRNDFKNAIGNSLNEGLTMLAIGTALSGGKLMDLLSTGLKKLTDWAVKKGILSKDGKVYNKADKAQGWLKKYGEKWSKKIMSFFRWVAGGIVDAFINNKHFDKSRRDEIADRLGMVLFYMTIGVLGYQALSHFGDVGAIKQILTAVKNYELVIAGFAIVMWFANDDVKKHSLRDVVHTLEQCVEGQASNLVKNGKFRDKMIECTIENISGH